MHQPALRVVFFFALAACTTLPPPSASRTESAADLKAKTVALVAEDAEGQARAYCSGVWVSDNLLLTALHCVEGLEVDYATPQDVKGPNQSFAPWPHSSAKLVSVDEEHDLALLRAQDSSPHAVTSLSTQTPAPGLFAQTMGHPLGLWWSWSSGSVAAIRELEPAQGGAPIWFVQASAPISPGNSGGGLFDEDGRLMGIAHATFPKGQNLNLFIHRSYVEAFLKRNGVPEK